MIYANVIKDPIKMQYLVTLTASILCPKIVRQTQDPASSVISRQQVVPECKSQKPLEP